MNPAVLMTDPRYFAIKGGANPHTRLPDNTLKTVQMHRAWPQWHAYVDRLLERGVDVYIIDATAELTGMVFAANAGFLPSRLDASTSGKRLFYPSHFTAKHRLGESAIFAEFMQKFGFISGQYPDNLRFEGEADAFPVGRGKDLRWVFTWGFRSDEKVADWLESRVLTESMIRLKLKNPKYYHGDCLLCDLGGPLLAWTGGLETDSVQTLRREFGDRVIEMRDDDASDFIGNSFYVETQKGRILYTPAAIDARLRDQIEVHGIETVPVDVSEFFGKGGGGPKCMVFNLGQVDPDDSSLTEAQRAFRKARDVRTLRQTRWADTRP